MIFTKEVYAERTAVELRVNGYAYGLRHGLSKARLYESSDGEHWATAGIVIIDWRGEHDEAMKRLQLLLDSGKQDASIEVIFSDGTWCVGLKAWREHPQAAGEFDMRGTGRLVEL